MANVTTDKITETYNGQNPTSTTVSSPRVIGGTTLTCASLAGWPTNTAVHFATFQADSNNNKIAGTQVDWKGVVSGSSINSLTRQGAAADGGNSVGDIAEMMPTYSWAQDLAKGLESQHNNDGTHAAVTATSVTTTGGITAGSGLTMSAGTFSLTGTHTGWVAAGETWSYSSWDSTNVTGVITVPFDATTKYSVGMKVKFTNGSVKYGIITAVTATSLTLYMGTDYVLTNTTISSPFYSSQKAPYGFPMDPTKWTVVVSSTANLATSSSGSYAQQGSVQVSVPIGAFELSLSACFEVLKASATDIGAYCALSTSTSSATDAELLCHQEILGASATIGTLNSIFLKKYVIVASPTTYYLVSQANAGVTTGVRGDSQTTYIRAVCTYL